MPTNPKGNSSLITGVVAAILASACCLIPFILLSIGLSGAWLSSLSALDPFRPLFIGIALIALYFAYRNMAKKAPFWVIACLVALFIIFPHILPYL
ncbi:MULTISPECIES: mercuric transporter MerT family protein [unclassified Idiomarina]|jgi:mercuric ion transport protein|uniref:mercuric transporter MerT family protein n=1 Tax=unclassified Idiomarina TaxID=2614829 RepID=UPI00257FC05B|nr:MULTISPECIES: mercuric transporter MerT family protein [unclassified Idiomarina]